MPTLTASAGSLSDEPTRRCRAAASAISSVHFEGSYHPRPSRGCLLKQGEIKDAISQWQTSLNQLNTGLASDREPTEITKVQKKLEGARVRLAKEEGPRHSN